MYFTEYLAPDREPFNLKILLEREKGNMDNQFVFTPEDVYKIILAAAGFIVAVAGAVKVIMEAVNKAREPDRIQNERITKLEDDVMEIKATMDKYAEHQAKADEAWNIYMEAMFALINYSIDGEDISELKKVRKEMQDFLTKHRRT